MKIFFLGDIVGKSGCLSVKKKFKKNYKRKQYKFCCS